MKTFEERYTAWIDGQLSGRELADFEKELARHPEATSDREDVLKLGRFLRQNPTVPDLVSADFFALQIARRLVVEEMPKDAVVKPNQWYWRVPELLYAAAASLLIAAILFVKWIPTGGGSEGTPYFAQVVEAWPSEPGIFANTVYNPKDNVTVLWLDGLDYLPASYELK